MRVVQNGLIAYALCQHWGNRPEQFAGSGPGAAFVLFANAASDYVDLARNPGLLTIVGLHTPRARRPESVRRLSRADSLVYNYTIEGGGFQLVVTDSRTWRAFPRRRAAESSGSYPAIAIRGADRRVPRPSTTGALPWCS